METVFDVAFRVWRHQGSTFNFKKPPRPEEILVKKKVSFVFKYVGRGYRKVTFN